MKDDLQFPLSIAFTRFLNVFSVCIPSLEECGSAASGLLGRLGVLMLALIFTGIGAAMSLSMRLVPNPGDGLAQVFADTFGIGTGLMKNCVDAAFALFCHCSWGFCLRKTGRNRHWNGLCCRAGGARDCAVSSYFLKGDAAGGWTGKWQN